MDFDLTEKHKLLSTGVKDFCDREIEPRAAGIDSEGRLPDDLITKMAQLGLLGMVVPTGYGGGGEGFLSCALAIEQIAYSCTGAEWLVGLNNSIPACIARFGSEHVKRQFLPALCDGSSYASIQFTEEETGSDPEALRTRAVPHGSTYVINGMKRFSTFGARDGYAVVYGKDETGKCTAFVVKKNGQGYSAKKTWKVMGSGGVEAADVYFDDFKAPAENMLGEKGRGFSILLAWVAIEKAFQCAANVGLAQAASDEAIKYAKARITRGKPMADMQGIRWMLADMQCQLEASRWLTYRTVFTLDQESPEAATAAATAKLFVVPATIGVVESARRIHGAYGYAQEFKIERLCRAVVAATSVATTLEVNRSIVASQLLR